MIFYLSDNINHSYYHYFESLTTYTHTHTNRHRDYATTQTDTNTKYKPRGVYKNTHEQTQGLCNHTNRHKHRQRTRNENEVALLIEFVEKKTQKLIIQIWKLYFFLQNFDTKMKEIFLPLLFFCVCDLGGGEGDQGRGLVRKRS